ncbi:MAG: response regulator transcription factor, partial [Chitinophagaceae bacterium]
MKSKKIDIIIVDDHVLIAEMWAELINSNPLYQVVAICNNTDTSTDLVKNLRPDIVIMDINIQPISGIDATKIIKKISPGTKVIG